MVVGKCFGINEVQSGQPFVGSTSKPLWDAWREAGIPDLSPATPAYLTNLIKFCPPLAAGNKIPKEWVADGLHLLMQEIAMVRPQVILLLGADVLKAIYGPKAKLYEYYGKIAKLEIDCRAAPEDEPDIHRCQVIATDHPASVYRETSPYSVLLNGMKAVARCLGYTAPSPAASIAIDHQPVYTLAELKAAVDESIAASSVGGYLAFDCEWEGEHPSDAGSYLYTVQWSHKPGHARVVFLKRCGGIPNAALEMHDAVPLLKKLFEGAASRGTRLVGHFAKADLPWLLSIGVDLYPYFVGPDDDPVGTPDAMPAWQKAYFEEAFDTYVAGHSWSENQELKLEVMAAVHCGIERYDAEILAWRSTIKKSELLGYGRVSETMICPYAAYDADASGRLYLKFNGDPRDGSRGLLDADQYGQSCRRIFALRMRAWGAWAEMERYGILVDLPQQKKLRELIAKRHEELLAQLREDAKWPDLSLSKQRHKVELLFGEQYTGCGSVRPNGALSLYLKPYKTTKTVYKECLWDEALAKHKANPDLPAPKPSADQETIIHKSREHPVARQLLDIEFLGTAMKILFRPPEVVEADEESEEGREDGEQHAKGILAQLCGDGRIRSTFGFVETGRASSSRPNLQNISSGRDEQFDRILGYGKSAPKGSPEAKKHFVSRSMFKATDGWFIVGADLKGAEIAAAAINSNDQVLLEHVRRATLPEDDPQYLDLHSDLANRSFKLNLPLAQVKAEYKALRIAAKKTRFGHYYGGSAETILRQALEETADVTIDQIKKMLAGHDETYPALTAFFHSCPDRVVKVGWMANGYGGRRRFRRASEREAQSKQGREAQNWTCQGIVADNINLSLGNLWYELRRRKMRSRIILSVHDSIMLECPPDEVEFVVDVLLPLCMTERSPVIPTDFNGTPNGLPAFRLGIDIEVCRNWGITLEESEWRLSTKSAA
jgi:uracil-DNA glycosylase family 4